VPVVLGFNYEVHSAATYKFNTSAISFGFGDPDTFSGSDILATDKYLPVFFGHIFTAHEQKLLFLSFQSKF